MIYFTLMNGKEHIAINPKYVVSVYEAGDGQGSEINMLDGCIIRVVESQLTVVGALKSYIS